MAEKKKKYGKLVSWIVNRYESLRTWYHKDDNYLRRLRFPGTKLPMLDVIKDFIKLFTKGRTMDRAAGVAFNFFVALFPLVLFFFTLIPYIPIPHLDKLVMFAIMDFIPKGTVRYVHSTIESIMSQSHDGLLSVSILLCFVFGSSGIVAFFNGFRNVYANYVSDKELTVKGWIIQRLFAILMLIVIGVLLLLSIVLITSGGMTLKYLSDNDIISNDRFVFFLFNLLRWIVAVFVLCLGISMLYYFGNVRFDEHYRKELKRTRRNGKKYREFVILSPGTILATSLFVIGTICFNGYVLRFSRYNVLYGSIGTLIVLLLWIWIVAILILTGNDLNSGIRRSVDKLSAAEDNKRKKQVVIDSLRKQIQVHEHSMDNRRKKIDRLHKEIAQKEIVIHDLEEQNRDSELVIEAYTEFLEQEMRRADEENLDMDSMRDKIANDKKA